MLELSLNHTAFVHLISYWNYKFFMKPTPFLFVSLLEESKTESKSISSLRSIFDSVNKAQNIFEKWWVAGIDQFVKVEATHAYQTLTYKSPHTPLTPTTRNPFTKEQRSCNSQHLFQLHHNLPILFRQIVTEVIFDSVDALTWYLKEPQNQVSPETQMLSINELSGSESFVVRIFTYTRAKFQIHLFLTLLTRRSVWSKWRP